MPVDQIRRLKAGLNYKSTTGQDGIDKLQEGYKNGTKQEKRKLLEKFAAQPDLKWAVHYVKSNVLWRKTARHVRGRAV